MQRSNRSWTNRSVLPALRRTLAVGLFGLAGAASAGSASWNEQALDTIFSQASFGSYAIDIRFNAPLSVVAADLLSIDTNDNFDGEFPSLSALAGRLLVPDSSVSVFFVDSISSCGVPLSSIVGCASQPGHLIALQSDAAAGSNGVALFAHELGHNLGLVHESSRDNLMNGSITGATTLTTAQIGNFLDLTTGASRNPVVQNDAGQLFISVTPIAVLAMVPEPQTWAMLSLGLIGVAGFARRQRARSGR